MTKKKNALLWKIQTGKQHASYVFGTMHVMDQRAFRYKDIVEEKIKTCEVYAAEMDLDAVNQAAMAETMDLDEDLSLSSLLKPKHYQRLEKLLEKEVGMPLAYLDKSQPLLISNLLTGSQLSKDMPLSLDATLWQFAKEQDRIMIGVESFEEQIAVLEQIPLDYQLKGLVDLIKNFKNFKKQLHKLTRLYEQSDIQNLWKQSKRQAGKMRKMMIYDRNKIMAERIADLAREKSIFASIGAGHLSGQKGVLRLLKQDGFKLKPIRVD